MRALEKEVLSSAILVGSWHVTAATLVAIGALIERGHLTAQDDDYGGPILRVTEAGIAAALSAKIVQRDDAGRYRPPAGATP
jgi:hypothetical protein